MANPLRPPPKPFIRRPVKSERPRTIPSGPKQEVEQPGDYKEYPLRACTQNELTDIKRHILKFQSKLPVQPHETFTKPVRLHRKETRNLQYQLTRAEIEQRQRENAEAQRQAAEEREKAEKEGLIKPRIDISNDPNVAPEPVKTEEEKRIEKMAKQQMNIAPDGGARNKIFKQDKRKTKQVRVMNEQDRKLRYEEYYPWVMEDYDGQNTWVGAYEAASSDMYCFLIMTENGFKMVPADKVYRFTPRNKYATLTLEEAERRMERHNTVPRWLMKHLDDNEQKLTRYERTKKKLKTVEGNNAEGSRNDDDDLDFDEEFADDEEAPIIDGNEEENKESEMKMKKEMLGANAMGLHDEHEEDVDDLFEVRKVDKDGEKVRKTLIKTEAGMYDSDEEMINPYLSQSDLEQEPDEEVVTADLSKPVSPVGSGVSRQASPPAGSRIKVKSVNAPVGMVVLKGLASILMQFPRGDWNPSAKKRAAEHGDEQQHDTKRIKLEGAPVKSESPVSIPCDDLLTEEDILNAVKSSEKITAKELISKFKHKLKNPENKTRIKILGKQLLKNQDGYVVPK
jgi:transcription initiation factor TFIIF subunit alpha